MAGFVLASERVRHVRSRAYVSYISPDEVSLVYRRSHSKCIPAVPQIRVPLPEGTI